MLNFTHHTYNGKEYTEVRSDDGRYVVYKETAYISLWIPSGDETECAEGEHIPIPEPTADEALTRYANELTGENDPDLVSATESLIIKFTEE